MTGPEKDIWKRPLVLMVSLMGGIICSRVVFSFLIIGGIANIHNDPPYWRLFLYGLIDIGVLWQLLLVWQTTDAMQRLKSAKGALIMAALGGIQTLVAISLLLYG